MPAPAQLGLATRPTAAHRHAPGLRGGELHLQCGTVTQRQAWGRWRLTGDRFSGVFSRGGGLSGVLSGGGASGSCRQGAVDLSAARRPGPDPRPADQGAHHHRAQMGSRAKSGSRHPLRLQRRQNLGVYDQLGADSRWAAAVGEELRRGLGSAASGQRAQQLPRR